MSTTLVTCVPFVCMIKMKQQHANAPLGLKLLVSILSLLIFSVEISYGVHPDSDGANGIQCIGSGGGCVINPFAKGCLITVAEERGELDILSEKLGKRFRHLERVCNSNDAFKGRDDDDCVEEPGHQYSEIRIAPGNWDSSILLSWILQILLSVSSSTNKLPFSYLSLPTIHDRCMHGYVVYE